MPTGIYGSNPPKKFVCEYCSRDFYRKVYPSSKDKVQFRFCSPSCRNKARTRPLIPCPVCGVMFKDKIVKMPRVRQKYCSQQCAWKAQIGQESKTKTPQHIKDEIIKVYPLYGPEPIMEKFGMTRSAVFNATYKLGVKLDKDVFYDRVHKSAQKYMLAHNPMHRPEVVEKVKRYYIEHPDKKRERDERMLQAQSKVQRANPSGLEKKLWGILDSLGAKYEKQAVIKPKFIVDIKIGNLIIQADGEYWHGHKRFEPLTERQISQQKRDRAQDKYLSACGYAIERIWESDMCIENVSAALERHLNVY